MCLLREAPFYVSELLEKRPTHLSASFHRRSCTIVGIPTAKRYVFLINSDDVDVYDAIWGQAVFSGWQLHRFVAFMWNKMRVVSSVPFFTVFNFGTVLIDFERDQIEIAAARKQET